MVVGVLHVAVVVVAVVTPQVVVGVVTVVPLQTVVVVGGGGVTDNSGIWHSVIEPAKYNNKSHLLN